MCTCVFVCVCVCVCVCICVCVCVREREREREREMPINEDNVTYSCNSDVIMSGMMCVHIKNHVSKSTLDLATVCERPVS